MKKLASLFLVALFTLPLMACDSNDGPAEQLGENIDNAADETRDSIDDAADEIADGAEDTCEALSDQNC